MNNLYYGDNLEVLRKHVKDESVALVYIDPPFNSKRNYNQIYNNIGGEDLAQAQAFTDTWTWDDHANECFEQIVENKNGVQTRQSIDLICGLDKVLGRGSLFAYLVSMSVRIAEIHRTLKFTGSFYLHCDPTASHYLKLVCDALFVPQGGDFVNEVAWCYEIGGRVSKRAFGRRHDILLFYVKGKDYTFQWDEVLEEFSERGKAKFRYEDEIGKYRLMGRFLKDSPIKGHRDIDQKWEETHPELVYRHYLKEGRMQVDFWNIPPINQASKERLGYPTQKPALLLERVITVSSREGDTVLDAYCGCGTTIAVAERLKRKWVGIDITYQSISLVLKRLEDTFTPAVTGNITLSGIPKDMRSATALAHKKDDRVRKEFEKWAVLTYSNNRAVINQKKGADQGIDGMAYFVVGKEETERILFQVKSGNVGPADIRDLRGTIEQEKAPLGIFITLQDPTQPMLRTAHAAGTYAHPLMGRKYDKIQIVTVKDIIENGAQLEMPLMREVVKSAEPAAMTGQRDLFGE